ncbi:hypothetical protein PQR52_11240 [Paraburkholderia aspalathi]|uniref:hypothetical protein n=1 Tax=Paraburkholderia aspalathi TaxID=1324617 RepID=UPI0038B84C24
MFPEVSFAIAPSPESCGADQFCLRAHDWVRWEKLTVSPIAAVLLATAIGTPDGGQNSVSQLDKLRDELCDLLDALSAIGVQVPLTVVVHCEKPSYDAWHRLAGDQNWIRGTFFVEPFTEEVFAQVGIEGATHYATLLTDVEATHASKYLLRTLTNEDYLAIVKGRLGAEESSWTRNLASYVLNAFDEGGILKAGDAVGQRKVQNALRRWLNDEVVARARVADSDGPETGSTSIGGSEK